jgi:DNA-binding protein Fis
MAEKALTAVIQEALHPRACRATVRVWKKRLERQAHSRLLSKTAAGFRSRRGRCHEPSPSFLTMLLFRGLGLKSRIHSDLCACAKRSHAAAPPTSPMNSHLFTQSPRQRDRAEASKRYRRLGARDERSNGPRQQAVRLTRNWPPTSYFKKVLTSDTDNQTGAAFAFVRGGVMALNRFGCTLAEVEREHILETLVRCRGNRTRAAKFLDMSVRCLRMKLRYFDQDGSMAPPPHLGPPNFSLFSSSERVAHLYDGGRQVRSSDGPGFETDGQSQSMIKTDGGA